MAQFSTRYQGKGRGKRATKFQIASKVFATSITLSANMYDEADAQDCRNILNEIERLRQIGSPLTPEIIRRIDGRPHFKSRLAEKGIVDVKDEITLGELFEKYFDAKRRDWTGGTEAKRCADKNSFFRFFDESERANEVDEKNVLEFKEFLFARGRANGAPFARATANRTLKSAREVFEWSVKTGILRENVFKSIKIGGTANPDKNRYIETQTVRRLLATCDLQEHWEEERRQEWRVLIVLCRVCGLRNPTETTRLKWSDVDFAKGELHIDEVKNKRRRVCPMFAPVRVELERLREIRGDNPGVYVVESLRTCSNMGTTFKKLVERAGLALWPKIFHNLRKSAATDICNAYGAKSESVWLGHTERISFDFYQQITPETITRALNDDWGLSAPDDRDAEFDVLGAA